MRNNKYIKFFLYSIVIPFFLLLEIPSLFYAQTATWYGSQVLDLFRNAPWKIGIIRGYRAFSLSNAGYDSDIYYGYLEQAHPDFTFAAGPTFQWFVPFSKRILFDSYQSFQGLFYFKYSKERALNLRLNNNFHFLFKKFYGEAGIGYSNLRDRFSPEMLMRARHEEIDWRALFLWRFSKTGAAAWQFRTSSLNYSHNLYGSVYLDEVFDRNESYADALLYFIPGPKYRFFLDGQIGLYNFKYQASKFKDSYTYAFLGGLEFTPPAAGEKTSISGRFSIGYEMLDPKNPVFKVVSEIVGNGQLILSPGPRLSLITFYSRDFNVSIYSNLLSYILTSYGGGFTFNINNRINLNNQLVLSNSKYPYSTSPEETALHFKFSALMTSLNIRIGKEWSINIFGTFYRRTTLPENMKFLRHFIGFNLIFGAVPGESLLPVPSFL